MKLQFESNLDYQIQAIEAACDLFLGQTLAHTEFTVTRPSQLLLDDSNDRIGIGNRLTLLEDQLFLNLQLVQQRSGLSLAERLLSRDFTIEMETGTGKTYVYLRTIFELNKRYGFNKFVIVVPSIAIKEGVYKTLQITRDHFKSLYNGVPYDYFVYDSAKLGQVRNFATSPQIQIMVVTVGAINRQDTNNLYKENEKMGGETPIDLIRATNPILIIDEPQSVDGGLNGEGRKALDRMHALCTLRYSATHKHPFHMIFRLDAVDAYERKLVKQIEVASAEVINAHNQPFIRFISAKATKGDVSATVEIDVEISGGRVQRREKIVRDGDDLEQLTNRSIYANCRIGEIRTGKGNELLELLLPGRIEHLKRGQTWGDVDMTALQRQMIRRTIKEHFEKEKRLNPHGIKVLSLFFIDSVDRYRFYESGIARPGIYAQIFEEEYQRLAKHPDYQILFDGIDVEDAARNAHNGYFSIDKKSGLIVDTTEKNKDDRAMAADAYALIMRKKEELLDRSQPLRFIFSHSALREGWDNPNVFQICTLRDMQTQIERRQTIGRGLRLCVNSKGDRVRGDVNVLTVIAPESYQQFAENLQREIEEETGITFGVVDPNHFTTIAILDGDGVRSSINHSQSSELWSYLKSNDFIDAKGHIQDALRLAIYQGSFQVPGAYEVYKPQIIESLRRLAGRVDIKNADERRGLSIRRAILDSDDFKALWDRIKYKTTYRVDFDNEQLIRQCINAINEMPSVVKPRVQWRKADIDIDQSGVTATERDGAATITLDEGVEELPDILTELQNRTHLTRRSIYRILSQCDRLNDFRLNPQQFIQFAAESINAQKQFALVGGIKYQQLTGTFYTQELFENAELTSYLKNIVADTHKSIYDGVVCDSLIEQSFVQQLEMNAAVKVYSKLPGWFTIPTPLGNYNPDWAVLIDTDEGERLYFVVETKGSLLLSDLRNQEAAKIRCGKEHFRVLSTTENPIHFTQAVTLDDVLSAL